MTGIYLITNMVNGKRYVGQSVNIERRFWDHNRPNEKSIISKAVRKYGKINFKREVLEECVMCDLDTRELYWINTLKPEYNIRYSCNVGGTIHCYPDYVIEKIRAKAKSQWAALSEEKKRHVVQRQLTGPRAGYIISDGTKEKLRQANLGKKWKDGTREKVRQTWKNRQEQGWVKSGEAYMKPVRCLETGIVFRSVKDAAAAIGAHPGGISAVLKGRQGSCRGLHFEYCGVETIRDECSEVGLRREQLQVRGIL